MTPHEFYLKYWKVNGDAPTMRDMERYYFQEIVQAAEHARKNGLEMRLMKFRGGKEQIVFVKPS